MSELRMPAPVRPAAVDGDTEAFPTIAPGRKTAWPRRILVATNGSRSSNDALLAAGALADRCGASIEIATVYAPHIAVPSGTRQGSDQCEGPERVEAALLLKAVRKQCRDSGHARHHLPIRFEVGDPSSAIVQLAQDIGADLVMLGIGHREPAYRWIGGHTSMRVARYLGVPLYASAYGCESPDRCVVALSNGTVNATALRAASACVSPGGHIWVAVSASASMNADALETHARDVEIERVTVEGDMLSGVLRVADDVGAQLIVVPNHGDPGPTRAFLPNLAEPLLLASRCSVLAVTDQVEASPLSDTTAT